MRSSGVRDHPVPNHPAHPGRVWDLEGCRRGEGEVQGVEAKERAQEDYKATGG